MVKPLKTALLTIAWPARDGSWAASRAVAELRRTRGLRVIHLSRIRESDARGGRVRVRAVECAADLSPMGLLIELRRIEARLGRRPGTRALPRPVRIDVMSFAASHGSARLKAAR